MYDEEGNLQSNVTNNLCVGLFVLVYLNKCSRFGLAHLSFTVDEDDVPNNILCKGLKHFLPLVCGINIVIACVDIWFSAWGSWLPPGLYICLIWDSFYVFRGIWPPFLIWMHPHGWFVFASIYTLPYCLSSKSWTRLGLTKLLAFVIKLSNPTNFLCVEIHFLIYDVGVKIYKALKDVLSSIVLALAVV